MVDTELYIKEGLKIVKTLLEQGNFVAARTACQELLKVNPYHRKVLKYLRCIQEEITAQNEEKVDADIEATDHLWKEEQYEELLKIYTKLYQNAPQHNKLKGLIEKLNNKLSKQVREQRADFLKKALIAIDGLMREKHFGDVIQACNELLTFDPLNKNASEYLQAAKNELIEQKLRENERIIDSADFERALEFYDTLLGIDPENTKVKNLSIQAKTHLASQKMLADRIHLNESVARMKALFKQAEYEKVLQACEEIERLERGSWNARIFRKKAKRTIHREIEAAITKKLKEAWKELQSAYEKDRALFVRI